jgi:predicted nucleotidyltransferase
MNRRDTQSIQFSAESASRILADFMASRQEIVLAFLFGSLVNREKGPVHDIDVAVLVLSDRLPGLDKAEPYGYRAKLIVEIAGCLKPQPIDLVLLNQASPVLLRQVIGKGRLIYCVSEEQRIRFVTSSLKRYADTAHLRDIKRLYRRKRIEKGLHAYAGSNHHRNTPR